MLIYGHNGITAPIGNIVPNEWLVRWIGQRLGIADFGPCVTIGFVRHGKLQAVVLYNKYLYPNIEGSLASIAPSWCTREALHAIFSYPFLQLNCKRMTATTEATNQRTRAFLCRLGFKQEGYHPDALPTGDAVTYGLLRADAARWLAEESHVQTVTPAAA